jgi:hypothetical protein
MNSQPTEKSSAQATAEPPDQNTCDHVVGTGKTGGTIFPDLVRQSEATRGVEVIEEFKCCTSCGKRLK